MKKIEKIITLILIILGAIILILFTIFPKTLTGKAISTDHFSWTKAICNETHCQDYEIYCNGKNLIYQKPIPKTLIEKPINWTDSRNESWKNKICG